MIATDRTHVTTLETRKATREALRAGFDPSEFRGAAVTLAVPDATRPFDYDAALTPLLERLNDAAAKTTILVALGLHRPMTDAELAPLTRLADRFGARLVQHDARDPSLEDSSPSYHPRHILAADLLVCSGVVEPHQYAGFSGGVKTVAIGCASANTIGEMHGLEMLRRDGVEVGRIDGNPFQEALWDLAEGLPPMRGYFVIPDDSESCHGATFGDIRDAFERAVELASENHFRYFEEAVDWMRLKIPEPKAVNFYQASRAATYVALADRPAIRQGGLLIVEAACPEGIGEGPGEQACARALRKGKERLLRELRGEIAVDTAGGQQRAYVVAKSLEHCRIAVVGAPRMPTLEPMGIPQYEDFATLAEDLRLSDDGVVIERPFHRVPRLGANGVP